jgi:uncharacterized protein with PIN domain
MRQEESNLKFVVDAMLGRLAAWLRLAGCDSLYDTDIHDEELLEIATEENRILLTSDLDLFRKAENASIRTMLVRGGVTEEVARVFRQYGIAPTVDPFNARCSKCNGELEEIAETEKERVKDLVFDQTFDSYDQFWLCEECHSVYFQGGYWDNIQEFMQKVRNRISTLDIDGQ